MLSVTPRRRAREERIEAAAEALISDFGDGAYYEARRRKHDASSDSVAKDWADVAQAVARRTGSRVGFALSTQLAMNTFFVLDRDPDESRWRPYPEPKLVDEPKRTFPTPRRFRIQFIGVATASAPSITKEIEIHASDVSAAIIAAALATWPRKTTALRILDHQGREVFEQKADRR